MDGGDLDQVGDRRFGAPPKVISTISAGGGLMRLPDRCFIIIKVCISGSMYHIEWLSFGWF
jgi:hypothetical protein